MADRPSFDSELASAADMRTMRDLFSARIKSLGYSYFDAGSMNAALMLTPRAAERFFLCDYYSGDPWKYLPGSWPADDPVMMLLSRRSTPIDYLAELRRSPKTASILIQIGALKAHGVRKAWLIPCNTLGRLRWVTVYLTERRSDEAEFFQSTRDPLVALAHPLVDRLDALVDIESATSPVAIAEKMPVLLTEREHDCLGRLATGMTNAEIASELDLSEAGVRFHLKKVYRKLGVANRVDATAFAIEHGFVIGSQ